MYLKFARRKCRCCKELFLPDYRNGYHQVYCSKAPCRQASKQVSQRRWLHQAANRDYFRGPQNTQRVREWRRTHPGYWKKKSARPEAAQTPGPQALGRASSLVTQPEPRSGTLQDVCLAKHPAFIGLIALVTGAALQEDIASTARQLEARGRDILGLVGPSPSPNVYDRQTLDSTRAATPGAAGLQLGGSPPGEPELHRPL